MKAIFSLSALKEAIKSASLAAKTESPKPILRNVLLTVEGGKFEAVATTMEQTIKTSGETYQTIEAGKTLLTPDAVKRIIGTKQNQKITIEGNQQELTVLFESSKATFATEDYEEFPSCKSEKAKTLIFSLDASQIIEGYTRTEKSTEKDNGKYALGGMLLDVMDADSVSFVSTDGMRLAVQTYATKTTAKKIFILPKAFFALVKKLFKNHGKIDFYALGECAVIFQSEKTEYAFPLLEGRFPEWRLGINQLNGKDIKTSRLNVASLLACDDFAQNITEKYNPGIVFDRVSSDSLVLFGRLGTNEAYTASKGHEIPDNFPLFKMNWYFLLDALKAVPKETFFDVHSVDSRNGVLMSEKSGFKYLVMPMCMDIKPELIEQAKAEITGNTSAEKKEEKPAEKPEKAPAKKTAKKAPKIEATENTATNTPKEEKAPETQAEEQETAKEETKEKEPEKEPVFYQVGKRYFFESDGKTTAFLVLSWNMNTMEIMINEHKSTVSKVLVEREGRKVEMANLPGEALATMEEKQEEKQPEQEQEQEKEKRVKIAPTGSSAPLATVTPAKPAPVESAPLPSAAEPSSRAEKAFEIGTYTTKKGKVKTAIRFFQPPTPSQIEALKSAFYWEFNGTWNGSPRKLPEIFKH